VILGQQHFERREIAGGRFIFREANKVRRLPSEYRLREALETRNLRNDLVVLVARQNRKKPLVLGPDVPVDLRLCRQQSGSGHDKSGGLNVAEPFQMRLKFRVPGHECDYDTHLAGASGTRTVLPKDDIGLY